MPKSQRISLAVAAALVAAGTLLLLIVLTGPIKTVRAAPNTLCVAPGGSGCDLGVCGSTCYASVQSAIGAAAPGDEILVAAGVYTRNGASWVAYINEGITIRGGYTTTNWTASYPVTQATTLDGEGQVGVVYISGDFTPTLEGLWLTNGRASDGGGIYALNAHPVISGCRVFSNAAVNNGGGIRLRDSPGAVLMNNRAYSNTAANGGGVYVEGSANTAVGGNTIYSNTADYGGGLVLGSSPTSTLTGNDVFNNVAHQYGGGGVYISNSGNVTLVGNRIFSNTADYGGGLVIGSNSDDVLLLGNEICSNTVSSSGSGLLLSGGQNVRLVNTLIAGNRAAGVEGAGLHVINASVHLLHTTLARNSGSNGVYATGTTSVWMTNTILVSHTVGVKTGHSLSSVSLEATLWGGGEWANGADVQGIPGTITTGTVNVWGDPAFVAPDSDDYHIGLGSAAIDRGVDAGVTEDIDGDPRPIGRPDLGVDERGTRVYLPLTVRSYP
jgi:parallel beta-helix repeat protein